MDQNYSMLDHETNVTKITIISLVSLFLALSMVTTYFPSEFLNLIGLIVTSYFIFHNTLRKNDVFAFVMVMYFCSLFPYLVSKGGAFNLVGFVVVLLYLIACKDLPGEIPVKDKWFKLLIAVFVLSSILGWFTNYTGRDLDIVYSVITFFGVVFLFLVASRIIVTEERIRIFIQINMVLIIYSTIVSLNKYLKIVTFDLPFLPLYGSDQTGYFEGGGIIGSSPLYGEYSMILAILFTVFLVIGYNLYRIRKSYLILFIILSVINVFMSISRSVLMLSFFGVAMIIFLQFKINAVRIQKPLLQIIMIALIGFATIAFIQYTNLDIVFDRMEQMQKINQREGGVTIDRIIDGSAFNRGAIFSEGYDKYNSKDTWWVGYGWGLTENNRDAFFVNSKTTLFGSAHSQFFAVLFVFGWLGFIAYFGLIIRLIWKSYRTIGNSLFNLNNRITAYFFMIAFVLFILNEIKVDSIYIPGYFAATMLLLGIAYANINSLNFKIG
jgi:O-antigen ligase